MSLIIAMKSSFTFDRMKATLDHMFPDHEFNYYSKNANTPSFLDEALDLTESELVIIDQMIPEYRTMMEIIQKYNKPVIVFESDFIKVVDKIGTEFLGVSPTPRDTSEQDDVEAPPSISHSKPLEYAEPSKVKVVEKIVEKEKEIFVPKYSSVPKKLLITSSLWSGAGSSTLAINLARAFAKRNLHVSYIEFPLNKPFAFDYLDISFKEEHSKTYIDMPRRLHEGESFDPAHRWNEGNVNWYVIDPRKPSLPNFSNENLMKLLYSVNATITIVDISTHITHQQIEPFLHEADEILVCVEPDPINLERLAKNDGNESEQTLEYLSLRLLEHIEQREKKGFQFVNMKQPEKFKHKDWIKSLNKTPITTFPALHFQTVLNAKWDSQILIDVPDVESTVEKALKPILVRNMPKELYELQTDRKYSMKDKFSELMKGGKA